MKNEEISALFDTEVTLVENAFPSIYNKDNVITILNKLKTQVNEIVATQSISADMLDKLKDEVISHIENYDYDSDITIDLGYDGRNLEVSFDTRVLTREVQNAFNEFEVI